MQLLQRLSFIVLLMSLVACGGGDGDLTGGGGGEEPDVITLSLVKSDGDLSGDNDITISATVMQGSTPVSGQLVTFALTGDTETRATLSSNSKATESDGVATIIVQATALTGGVEVTATVTDVDPDVLSFNSTGGGIVVEPPEGPVADSISLFASSQQLASSGAQEIELIAVVKDANNNLLADVNVSFTADSGAIEQVKTLTGNDGKATVKLKTESENANRIITTTATSGSASDSLEIQVVGTTVTLTGSSSLAINDTNNFIVKVLDSDGEGIALTTVTLPLTNESTETPAGDVAAITLPESIVTDHTGQATVVVTGTTGGTNTIIASALGANAGQKVAVQADSFLFRSCGAESVPKKNFGLPEMAAFSSAF